MTRNDGGRGGRTPAWNLPLLRSAIAFALLASAVSVHFQEPDLLLAPGFQLLYAAVALSYGWLLVRNALWGTRDLPRRGLAVQAAADVAFVSLLVYATGLGESVFAFVYVVAILLGCLEAYMKGALLWAGLSATTYVGLLHLQSAGILTPPGIEGPPLPWKAILRPALTNASGFLITGVLAGLLGEEIRKTRRRVAAQEDHLQKLETFHKHVVENIPSGILTTDTEGRINLINGTACAILGLREEAVAGRTLEEMLAGDASALARRDTFGTRLEVAVRRPGAADTVLGFSSSPLRDAEGRVIGRVVIFQDLTPVKQMEERVRLADRLAGVGELAAGLAHEIRNPLASVAGASQMLRELPDLPGESLPLLDIIERESTRLNGLITDFLAFTGPSRRNVGPVNLADLAADVAGAVRAGEAREKGIAVEAETATPACVAGDAEQLKQVVWNLVRNAIQATPPGGRVVMTVDRRIRRSDAYAVVSVRDTGEGIPPGILGRIFHPFFTSKAGGTGLGLSISQRIVHFHSGFIEVKSEPGRGSVFSVFLPEIREAVGAGAPGP